MTVPLLDTKEKAKQRILQIAKERTQFRVKLPEYPDNLNKSLLNIIYGTYNTRVHNRINHYHIENLNNQGQQDEAYEFMMISIKAYQELMEENLIYIEDIGSPTLKRIGLV